MKKSTINKSYDYLAVLDVEPECKSKSGIFYKLVKFELVILNGTKETRTGIKAHRPFWKRREERQINWETRETRTKIINGDKDYETVKRGDNYCGTIKEFQTTPYTRNGSLTTKYLCVLYEDEYQKAFDIVTKQLEYFRALPLDENGKPYRPQKINSSDWVKDEGQFDEDYEESAADHEDDVLEFLSGGDIEPNDFDGDWDSLHASRGLD